MLPISSGPAWVGEVPPLGFGCCPMGGHGWGTVDEEQLVDAVHTALDLGVRLFDTSDIYGLGASESLLGQALRGQRERAIIATKFGVRHVNGRTVHDSSVAWIRSAIDASLRRLGVDCIDLYQMHYWDKVTPMQDIVDTLERMLAAGKIRSYGITNHDPRDTAFTGRDTRIAAYSYEFSLVHRQREAAILDVQSQEAPLFMSWGSLGQGILSGKYQNVDQLEPGDRRRRAVYGSFHGEQLAAVQRVIEGLRIVAAETGIATIAQLSLRWIVDRVPRALPLVGIKRPQQIIDAAGILDFSLDAETCARLDDLTRQFETTTASP